MKIYIYIYMQINTQCAGSPNKRYYAQLPFSTVYKKQTIRGLQRFCRVIFHLVCSLEAVLF